MSPDFGSNEHQELKSGYPLKQTPKLNSVSPVIFPTHIDPQTREQTPLQTAMDVSGSLSPPPLQGSNKMAEDLQGLLDQFDPLTLGEGGGSTNSGQDITSEQGVTKKSINKQGLNPTTSNERTIFDSKPPLTATPIADALTSAESPQGAAKRGHEHKKSSSKSKSSEKTIRRLPQPEEELPFDFQRFLDQLRHKSADPIARYVKSFLTEFNKRRWTANEQVKIVGDFKAFIAAKMDSCPPFSSLSDHEMRNALEGMEKLLMNRLYQRTFSPQIKPEFRSDLHEEDVLRDKILGEKMRIWHWVEGRHLDLADRFLRNGDAFVKLASDELLKINHYRAPRDKIICILNCCKVIFGLLRQTDTEESADAFLPILIYVLLKAQPPDFISNVNYIQRFRNPDMLNGEAGYYLSSIIGAISFIETLDRANLSITDEEFDRNVEQSVRSIAEPPSLVRSMSTVSSQPPATPDRVPSPPTAVEVAATSAAPAVASEKPASATASSPGVASPETADPVAVSATPTPDTSGLNASSVLHNSAGLFSAPFKTLSKLFEAEPSAVSKEETMTPEESAARQASAEEHEAQKLQQVEFETVTATLKQMFPILDKEVIEDILREKQGRVGSAVDVCLALVG